MSTDSTAGFREGRQPRIPRLSSWPRWVLAFERSQRVTMSSPLWCSRPPCQRYRRSEGATPRTSSSSKSRSSAGSARKHWPGPRHDHCRCTPHRGTTPNVPPVKLVALCVLALVMVAIGVLHFVRPKALRPNRSEATAWSPRPGLCERVLRNPRWHRPSRSRNAGLGGLGSDRALHRRVPGEHQHARQQHLPEPEETDPALGALAAPAVSVCVHRMGVLVYRLIPLAG